MRSLSALIWRNLTAHPLRSILTALAITLGVAMVLAASIVGQAAGQSAAGLSEEGPHVGLEVFSRDGAPFDDLVLGTLRASPNVDRVSPSLRVEVEGVVPEITGLALLGVDPEAYQALHEPELAGGAFLDGSDTIVLPMKVAIDNRLNVGDEITLLVPSPDEGTANGQVATLTVVGRLKLEQDMAALTEETVAYVPLSVAQVLADAPGQVDHIEVALRPDADIEQTRSDLAQVVGPDLVIVRAAVAGGVMGNVVLMQAGLAIVGLIILFAASFVILNAFAMSVTGRTREIGALRALGMTRRQILSTVLIEAGLLGLIGTVAGALVGVGLAWAVMHTFGTLEHAPLAIPRWGLALSALIGLAVTLIAAFQPAWRASRVSPIVAVRPETSITAGWYVRSGGHVGAILLTLLLLGLAAYGLFVRPDAFTALAVMVVGQAALLGTTVLLLPALVDPVTALCRPFLMRWLGTAGRLAADNLGRNKLRTVLTAGALTAGLTIIVATSGLMTAGLKGAISSMRSATGREDVLITADLAEVVASQEMTFDNFFQFLTRDDLGFDLNPVVEALNPLVESRRIEMNRYCFQIVPPELSAAPGAPGLFVDPEVYLRIGNFDFFEGDPETALEWMRRGRAVLLLPIVAERLGVQVGDDILVQTPHGEVMFTVAGIGGGGLLMTVFPYADGEAYFDVAKPSFLGIVVTEGQDVEATLAQVDEAIKPFPRITILDYSESLDPVLEVVDRLALLLDGLLLLAVVVAALGVVNTMVINVTERGREIGLLRAVGAAQRQVRRAVVAEATTLGLLAALVASGLGLLMLLTYGLLILPHGTASLGVRPDWETIRLTMGAGLRDLGVAAAVSLVFGPLVAALAAYYPARQAAALDVVEATRSERVTLKRTRARRPEGHRRIARSFTWTMVWRNLEQGRTRTMLSALAVALGAAMTVAADITSGAMMNAMSESESAQTFLTGLLDQLDSMLTLVGVGITFAAGFLVFNAFAMSVTQRRRQIGALRSLGMIRRQVMRLVLVEALVTGGVGILVGLIAGPLLGRGTIALMRAFTEGVFVFGETEVSTSNLLLAAVLGLGVTLLSALIPAWRATRISPLVALREELSEKPGVVASLTRKAWFLGMLIILAMAIYLIIAPPGEWVTPPMDALLTVLFASVWLTGIALTLPALIGGVGRWVRAPLTRFWGASGRLTADNLGRGRGRVTLTILTLAVALTMIVGMTGFIRFMFFELMLPKVERAAEIGAWMLAPFDYMSGMAAYTDIDSLQLPPDVLEAVDQVVEGRGHVMPVHFVIVPELSFLGSTYFSFVADPHEWRQAGNSLFTFTEGDWETALPIMESGCGVLVTPVVAGRNSVSVGDTFEVTGADGPTECTVAGIGSSLVGASVIGSAAGESFGITEPIVAVVWPLPGVDRDALGADVTAALDRYSGLMFNDLEDMAELQAQVMDTLPQMFSALLLLAIVSAALGVVNTTMMSVTERQRELGLLRAVGATRRQVNRVVTGEAALMGLIGGGLGLVAGVGIVVVVAVVYGGNGWGIPDLDLWGAAFRSVQPALVNGLVGLLAAPFICAGAAWLPVRSLLRGSAIETLEAERQPAISPRRAAAVIWRWGSIRARFTLGTAALMTVVLAGLIGVVTTHARVRIEEQTHDALRTMVAWNAGMIELGLPEDAETLDFDSLATGQTFDFDSDALLRFESLVDDMTANGLVDFTIADRDNVSLIGIDMREIGTLVPELETTDEADVYSEREGGEWLIHATAPVRAAHPGRADDGLLVGSVRMTVDAHAIQDFLDKLCNTLGAIGSVIVLVGVGTSWWLGTPLARATRELATRAVGVGRGEYALFDQPKQREIARRISLRTKLTVAMVIILVVMVGVLELVAIPVERGHVEDTFKDALIAGVEWIGQAASESFGAELTEFSPDQFVSFEEMLDMTKMGTALDLGRLQELTDQMRSDDAAFVALVDKDGTIIISDQLSLIGEEAPVPTDAHVEEIIWRDEQVWVASTPLRRGRDGELIGALRMAVRRDRVETFLDESRNLFRLTGLIAVLAGVLLAQAIGGAVTAPVRQLATGTRRVAAGDLSVPFDLRTNDELAMLAQAYNQMVIGLREREWLRDMFGRFVSHEVAEAIRTGQVKLEGENRVVSILFCDIRDFTARSEQSTPEEVVALLNEYLPVVVDAAQRHEGTVNKFGGDSTLVIYGAPRRLQESAYQAVLTALEMRANLQALNAKLTERGEDPIRIGVGINTGVALAGAVGPEERQEYTVIGDTVNLASRIEALNKEYPDHDILISGWTYEALGSRRSEFEFADLGEVQIRGKVEPVRVWAVESKFR